MNAKSMLAWLGFSLILGTMVTGCGDPVPQQVQETTAMSFEDVAERINQESSTSEDSK